MIVLYEPLNFAEPEDRAGVAFVARRHDLDPALVAAIVMQESGGNPFAIRYEPGYRWLWPSASEVRPPRGVSYDTEIHQQKTSWGAMQLMGACARELGCVSAFLSILCIPSEGLEWGCRHLAKYKRRWPEMSWYVSAYNAGHPIPTSHYVDSVMAKYEALKAYDWKH